MPVIRNPQFFFREGFCWSDINTTFLKCRIKQKSINDVKSMSLYGLTAKVPERFLICLFNSTFVSLYVDAFISNTQTFQINHARALPIIVPTQKEIDFATQLCNEAIKIKKNMPVSPEQERLLNDLQRHLDKFVETLYSV